MENKLNHVAIITDGNGRWATERGLPRSSGHDQGRETFKNIVDWALEMGLSYVTFYVMSLENLKRDPAEVEHIFEIGRDIFGRGGVEEMVKKGVRLICAGDKSRMNEEDRKCMEQGEKDTAHCDKMICVLCTCYGGRDEIVRAANQCVADGVEITEETISARLYASIADVPDPDLIIRTGGYNRLSGFLTWQSVYSEIYVTPTYYPDFSKEEFAWACHWYKRIKRTHGGDRQMKKNATATAKASEKTAPFARKE